MKKIIDYIVPILFSILYLLVGFSAGFDMITYTALFIIIFLFIASYLLSKKIWWGSIIGVLIGVYFIYLGTVNTLEFMNERLIGILVILIYFSKGILVFRNKK